MLERTRQLWETQDQAVGDRRRLYAALAAAGPFREVLYPGSYVDAASSTAWASVTYVDLDKRARRFFEDADGVQALTREHEITVESLHESGRGVAYTTPAFAYLFERLA
jgi:hypothetical protein